MSSTFSAMRAISSLALVVVVVLVSCCALTTAAITNHQRTSNITTLSATSQSTTNDSQSVTHTLTTQPNTANTTPTQTQSTTTTTTNHYQPVTSRDQSITTHEQHVKNNDQLIANNDHPTANREQFTRNHDHAITTSDQPDQVLTSSLGTLLSHWILDNLRRVEERETGSCSNFTLALDAIRCLEFIDSFRSEFVLARLTCTWSQAEAMYPPGSISTPYLPDLPTSHIPIDFITELIRFYSLMQHYLVAMDHLILDEALYYTDSFMENMNNVKRELYTLMLHMRQCMDENNLVPDNTITQMLTQVAYTNAQREPRDERDFTILRDTRVSLQCLRDVFLSFANV